MGRWTDEELRELEDPATWDDEHVEHHEPVRNQRSIVSVAFPRDDFERVSAAAQAKGMKLSEFIRNAALREAAGQG